MNKTELQQGGYKGSKNASIGETGVSWPAKGLVGQEVFSDHQSLCDDSK